MTATIPKIVTPRTLDDYLEVMTRAVFQTGVSWKQIAMHWDAYRRAFDDFHVPSVAAFGDAGVTRALDTEGVLRSPRKAQATVRNARRLLELDREHAGFSSSIASTPALPATCAPFRTTRPSRGQSRTTLLSWGR